MDGTLVYVDDVREPRKMTAEDHLRRRLAAEKARRKLPRYTGTVHAMMMLEVTRQEIANWPELTYPADPWDSPEFDQIEVDCTAQS